MAGDWDARPTSPTCSPPFAARLADARSRRCCSGCAALRRARASRARGAQHRRGRAGRTSTATTTCPTTCSRTFLDETMTYSSALVRPTRSDDARRRPAPQDRRLLDLAGVGAGTHVLEIGTGWGELAIRAAQRGATVHHAHPVGRAAARSPSERIAAAGRRRPGRRRAAATTARRDGQYDAVVSVEMIEAVGERVLADVLRRRSTALLAPGRPGRAAGDHDAARPDARHPAHLHLDPQVHLPRRAHPVGAGDRASTCAAHTTLRLAERRSLGPALRARRCALLAASASWPAGRPWPRSASTSTFRRMWDFYLAYSEAGFASATSTSTSSSLARDAR